MNRFRKVFAYHIIERNVRFFDSVKEASQALGVHPSAISNVCSHRLNSYGGFVFGKMEEFDKAKLDAMLDNARISNTGRVIVHITQDGTEERYDSIVEASRKTGIKEGTMKGWLCGKYNTPDGSTWTYSDEPFVPRRIRVQR